MPTPPFMPTVNRLLAALPKTDQRHIIAGCEPVDLVFAEVLAERGDRITHIYFPTGSFISLVENVDSHAKIEVGLVGNEGMVGASLVLGVDVVPLQVLVQGPGPALRMKTAKFRQELERSPPLQAALKRYLYVVMVQLAQTAACTRFHVVEARLARWLLMTEDRAHSHQFHITHEFLAFMLGVRRVGITKAASSLHKRGLINYSRGDLTIMDRGGLESAACSCYESDKQSYKKTMK